MGKVKLVLILLALAGNVIFYLSHQKKKPNSFVSKTKNREHEISGAKDALQFLSLAASFPNKDIPEDAYNKAYQYYQKKFLNNRQIQSVTSWRNIGPNNQGGRTISIVINPKDTGVVWLGSASGGLWKSTTGGTGIDAWKYIPTGFPVLGVSSIAINPEDTNVIFIGTGETYNYGTSVNGLIARLTRGSYGIGIIKSIDGGKNWTKSLDWTNNQIRTVWDLIINPKNPEIIYAATTEGIYKSTDAGTNWSQMFSEKMVMDLEIDRIDTNILYAGVGNMTSPIHGLYKTTNSGATWNLLSGNGLPATYTNTGRITITSYYSNPKILMTMIGNDESTFGLYRSEDEGQNWVLKNDTDVLSYQGWYAKGVLMKNNDSMLVMLGGVDLFLSFTTGTVLFDIANTNIWVHSDIHDIISNPLDPEKVYVITDGGLYRSDDFGNSFYECTNGYVTTQFYIGSSSAQDSNIVLGGLQDNGTVRFNGTKNWDWVMGGDGTFNAINQDDDYTQYAAYQYLQIARSDDQGISFPSFLFDGSATAAFVAPYVLCPSNQDIIYAGNTSINISTDGGFNWNTPNGEIDNGKSIISIAVSSTSSDTAYCSTAPVSSSLTSNVFKTFDGWNTFQKITGTLPNRYPRDIAVNPKNSRELYVVFSGFGTGHIYKSTDAGDNWSNMTGTLPDVPFHCVTIDNYFPNTIYAGSDLGTFVSKDGGQNWSAFSDGLNPATMVFDLVISPTDRNLIAFTHGSGVYKRPLMDTLTGIKELIIRHVELRIFPNPTNGNLRITIGDSRMENAEVRIYDVLGKNILHSKIVNYKSEILLNAPRGIYFIEVKGEKVFEVKKIVKE